MSSNLVKDLNKEQLKALTHDQGPLLIVAGAGTGKTTVLINRLAHLIVNKKVGAEEILLLTFTEKAAGEMEDRADKTLPYGYVDLWINTFHSFGERLLREHALDIGLSANFKLLTETEQWVLVKKNLEKFNLDYYRPLGNPAKFISELLRHFSRLKDENISPSEYLKYANSLEPTSQKIKETSEEQIERERIRELALAYQTYNQLLLDNNYLDFGDLIIYTLQLFQKRSNILKYYRHKFRYIMVDEFQDTNWAQYELIKLLAFPKNNLVVVGDDDQAIYKFRGASISNIMQFKDDFKGALEIVLTENYRSRQEILDHAYRFIQNNNPNRLEAKLKINKRLVAKGSFLKLAKKDKALSFYNFQTAADELSFVAQKILEIYESKQAQGDNILWSDFAILVRANDTADAYVKELNRYNIPNQFMSWRGLYYKPLILDILAYLRLLDNYHESTALFRVLNMEIFKVSHLDLITINKMAARKVWSLYEALKNIDKIGGLSSETYKNVTKLLALIEKHSALVSKEKPTRIFLSFAYDSGLLAGLDPDKDLEFYSYLNQFYQKIKRLEETSADLRLVDFLQAINLELEAGETGSLKLDFADHETVKIMTAHGAKG
ncbi:MAG: UvrD-helicase domain-containing protein, partial [Patescibacteria group bacterium]